MKLKSQGSKNFLIHFLVDQKKKRNNLLSLQKALGSTDSEKDFLWPSFFSSSCQWEPFVTADLLFSICSTTFVQMLFCIRGNEDVWGCHHQLYDHHRNPNNNKKDHLVGQLTKWISESYDKHLLIVYHCRKSCHHRAPGSTDKKSESVYRLLQVKIS